MKVSVTFNCDNACFQEGDSVCHEIKEVLSTVGKEIASDNAVPSSGIIFDRNGNLIGEYSVTGY
jgi:hypothetical protein